jgi:hypothetical protein
MHHAPLPEVKSASLSPPRLKSLPSSSGSDDFSMTFVMRKGAATYTFILDGDDPIMIVSPDCFHPQA